MSALAKLKLVAANVEKRSPVVLRRAKLTGKITDQIAAAKAAAEGGVYVSRRTKFVQDGESGERKQVETATRVKQWWWSAANGNINLALRYSSSRLNWQKARTPSRWATWLILWPRLKP